MWGLPLTHYPSVKNKIFLLALLALCVMLFDLPSYSLLVFIVSKKSDKKREPVISELEGLKSG